MIIIVIYFSNCATISLLPRGRLSVNLKFLILHYHYNKTEKNSSSIAAVYDSCCKSLLLDSVVYSYRKQDYMHAVYVQVSLVVFVHLTSCYCYLLFIDFNNDNTFLPH